MLQPVPVASLHHLTIVRCAGTAVSDARSCALTAYDPQGPALRICCASFGVDTRRESR